MNEEEFEKQTLDNLITDLKDIDKYTSFKNGAFIYDLGKYQGALLVNHIEQLQQENKKQKEVIDMFLNIVGKSKMLLNNPDLLDLYLKIKEVSE